MVKPPKIVFFTTDYPPDVGGLQEYSFRIASDLADRGLYSVEAAQATRVVSPRPHAEAVQYRFHAGRSRLTALLWSLVAAWRHRGIAEVYLHMQWSTAVGAWLLHRLGIGPPYVVLAHGAELFDPHRPILNGVKRSVLRGATAVVAGSQAAAEWAKKSGASENSTMVLHYGCSIPAAATHSSPASSLRFACLHRLVPRKGTHMLLEALSGLQDRMWIADIAGEGEEKSKLMRWVREKGLADRIRFLGSLPESEKIAFFRDHDLFILPSLPPQNKSKTGSNHAEGLGIALLEAQAAGVAVLAARTGGIPEAMREQQTGLLFTAGDVDDLRGKLIWILDHPEVLPAWGRHGEAWVAENFSWEKTMAGLAEVLAEVVRTAAETRPRVNSAA